MLEKLKISFYKPEDEFSPIPFWFWNDFIEESEISKQINDFKKKGVMGFVIHPRIGIPREIQYLSDRFLDLIKFAVKIASKNGMKVILYDEGMYPSGSAHGLVVKDNPEYASCGLRMIEIKCNDTCEVKLDILKNENVILVLAVEKLSENKIKLNSSIKLEYCNGKINFVKPKNENWSVLVFVETNTCGTIRGIHFGEDDLEPDAPASSDLLNPESVKKFIHITYDRYYSVLHEYFGNTIIAMFTDEPDVLGRNPKQGIKPWTPGFLKYYLENNNSEMDLSVLWFDAGEDTEKKRRKYQKVINRRLEFSYYHQISLWCEEHGIALTGHPHESDDIGLLKYFHIPGQDIVWRWVGPEDGKGIKGTHSTLGKCSSDAARHYGKRRNSNECFGCCGPSGLHWAFSMDDMKWYLDWLFVRGVNLINPHAFYYSIDGEKRIMERPPDVGPHNIWWKYYNTISDYIKRMSWLLTDSINITEIAILCEEDGLPWLIAKSLFENQVEFNYLEDNIFLSNSCKIINGNVLIQKQKYKTIIIENVNIITDKLKKRLQKFIDSGGKVVLYNSDKVQSLLESAKEIFSLKDILPVIEKYVKKDVFIYPSNNDLRITHIIKDSIHFYILVNEGENDIKCELNISINGKVEKWDPWNGNIESINIRKNNKQYFSLSINLARRESSIICIDTSKKPEIIETNKKSVKIIKEIEIKDNWKIKVLNGKKNNKQNLESWTEWDDFKDFSGTIIYDSSFELIDKNSIEKIEIDLGKVCEIAHLYINQSSIGFKMWFPYKFDITDFVKNGNNSVRVEITNSLANSISHAGLDSGLMGPVKIQLFGEK